VATNAAIRATVIAALQRKLDHGLSASEFGDDADLVSLGVVDSVGILDILLEVEAACGTEFDPERLQFEGGLTVRKLVSAFPTDVNTSSR
jgi:acyl carrier protein